MGAGIQPNKWGREVRRKWSVGSTAHAVMEKADCSWRSVATLGMRLRDWVWGAERGEKVCSDTESSKETEMLIRKNVMDITFFVGEKKKQEKKKP